MNNATPTPDLAVKITLYNGPNEGRAQLLGWAELVIDGAFVIKDIRIVQTPSRNGGDDIVFVSFPQKKGRASESYFDIAHPITHDAHKQATELILEEYNRVSRQARDT
jgi:DNA-binding cell septation regulator SpoVG